MKNKLFALLRALGITVGLNTLLLCGALLFSRMVHRESGQALLFLFVTLLLTAGVCLFAVIPAENRSTLWACMGVSLAVHLILSVAVAILGGVPMSERWPGRNNLAGLLVLLMSLVPWSVAVFTVTATRAGRLGKALREEKRQIRRAKKGYRKEWQTLSPARAVTLSVLQGLLSVLWLHILTGLVSFLLDSWGISNTMLSYVAFPTLWCLAAAAYGHRDRIRPTAYTLSAAASNLLLFILPTLLLSLRDTPRFYSARLRYYLLNLWENPFSHPDQMLAIGIFLTVWIAMLIFGVNRRSKGKSHRARL
jgi:FtsH-binding integral membrane protein